MRETVIFKLGSTTGSALPAAQTDLGCLTNIPARQVKGPPLAWPWGVGGVCYRSSSLAHSDTPLGPEMMLLVST